MKWLNIVWIILLIIYIFSPWDLHPSLFDDIVALAMMLYIWYGKRSILNRQANANVKAEEKSNPDINNLEQALACLKLSPNATDEEIKQAYHKRIAENHPDKVHHLSPELKERAHELMHQIQKAYDIILKSRHR